MNISLRSTNFKVWNTSNEETLTLVGMWCAVSYSHPEPRCNWSSSWFNYGEVGRAGNPLRTKENKLGWLSHSEWRIACYE